MITEVVVSGTIVPILEDSDTIAEDSTLDRFEKEISESPIGQKLRDEGFALDDSEIDDEYNTDLTECSVTYTK